MRELVTDGACLADAHLGNSPYPDAFFLKEKIGIPNFSGCRSRYVTLTGYILLKETIGVSNFCGSRYVRHLNLINYFGRNGWYTSNFMYVIY